VGPDQKVNKEQGSMKIHCADLIILSSYVNWHTISFAREKSTAFLLAPDC
jgi:hypothetical protein